MKTIGSSSPASTFFTHSADNAIKASGRAPVCSIGFLPSIVPLSTRKRPVADLYWYAKATQDSVEIWEDAMLVILAASGLAGTTLALF